MKRPLDGHVILIIEDEGLIAFDLQTTFEAEGAQTILIQTVEAGLVAVEQPQVCAAVVDHVLGDGDSSELCRRLAEREIPFITYTGKPHLLGPCGKADHVFKPADPSVLLSKVIALLNNAQV